MTAMKSKQLFILWALPVGATDRFFEVLVLSGHTAEQCDKIEIKAATDGFHGFRRSLLTNDYPDFTKALNV